MSKLVGIIIRKVTSVQAVFFLEANDNGTLFLLVITSDEEQRQAKGLGSTIEESCREIAKLVALVHHSSSFQNGIANDNPFFNRALHCPVIYLSGGLVLPARKPLGCSPAGLPDMKLWDRWYSQGKDFLSGAEYYLKTGAYGAALFSLQQCVESLLIAVIRSVLGYRVNNHNLSKLLDITQMFTDDLAAVFNLEDAESVQLFDLLKHAYVNVRYKDTFEPDTKSLETLYRVTKHFVSVVELVHQKYLLTNSI
ncbi:HEPN domain-containing protein [Mucilaginibacter sp.]|nr:HEPN domain-containing protein [Mucilaginibacter sp.]